MHRKRGRRWAGGVLARWLPAGLADLASTARHSEDFDGLRAGYVSQRVRLLCMLFAALAPLWIPIDWLRQEGESFRALLFMRLGFSAALLLLAAWSAQTTEPWRARLRLALFLAVSGAFYIGSVSLFAGVNDAGALTGYEFLPFVMVALVAVFPLTLTEGLGAVGGVALVMVGTGAWQRTLLSISALADLWLLLLLGAIALWASLTQLHMLLRLYREATRDPLTRLVNRRVLARWLQREVEEAEQEGTALTVLLFDLDLFKRINDTWGHLTGDAALRAFADLLRELLPDPDLAGRYGGEEFLAILPGVEREQAAALAERVRLACHGLGVKGPGGESVTLTTSVGLAQWQAGEDGEALLARVDRGLYQAKEAGRDRVMRAD